MTQQQQELYDYMEKYYYVYLDDADLNIIENIFTKNTIGTAKVLQFQQIFDTVGEGYNFEQAELRTNLIAEELKELIEALHAKDPKEVLDAYMDIIFLCIGGAIKHGFKDVIDVAFEEVCNSNLSKADNTYHDAMQTQEQYLKKGVKTEIVEKAEDIFVTVRASDGKVLKSYKYQEVKFEFLNK